LLKCKSCGGDLDLTMSACPSCGAAAELGRLTGILGIVCRACDAYNEPGARTCASCGAAVGQLPEVTPMPASLPTAGPLAAGAAPTPAALTPRPASPSPTGPPPAPGQPVLRAFQRGATTPTRVVPLVPSQPLPGATLPPPAAVSPAPAPAAAQPAQPAPVTGPLVPGRATLILERGEGIDGASFHLDKDVVGAGRTQGAVIFPDDPCLAPLHATFFYRDGALHLRDEGAPGGTYLRLRGLSVPLRHGDLFAVGDRLLRFAGSLPSPAPGPPDGTRRLGAPRPPTPTIVIEELLEGGVTGRVFVRGGGSVTIGRSGCAVNLGDDPHLSQAHAELVVDSAGSARLKDLGSSNGTFIRVPPHAERELHDGDWLRLGREVLRVAVT
jgi:pSer/pThr/pTyr-binding forkhead associated (FHA) protein